jgi:protocatechuate 3,4-dioxygenase beta subunit
MPPLLLLTLLMPAAAMAVVMASETPVVGLPCDGCELALKGLPANLPALMQLAPGGEPGEPMHLSGTVTDARGRPQAGIILYAHQTDATGIYPPAVPPHRHGRLRAWVKTDDAGSYTFHTVRPGAYPGRNSPQHIHMHVIEPGCALYYIADVLFRDDPLLSPALTALDDARGGSGLVQPMKVDGAWQVRRDIVLGQGVNGYPSCGRAHPEPQ